jgi:hypothetical protein
MNDEKSWYTSKSVIGSAVAILALIAGAFGYDVDADSQEQITLALIGVGGGVLAIYGRIKAVKKLTK